MPWTTTYVSQPTTITQLRGCTLSGEGSLEPPEQRECHDLHRHYQKQIAPESPRTDLAIAFGHARRSHASRAPSAINTPPVIRSSHAFTRGRVSTAPS